MADQGVSTWRIITTFSVPLEMAAFSKWMSQGGVDGMIRQSQRLPTTSTTHMSYLEHCGSRAYAGG
jgi:hypothetical protein